MANQNESLVCGNRPLVSASFGITSLTKKLTDASARLGTNPTHAFEIGDEFRTLSGTYTRERSVWQLRSDDEINSADIDDHIRWLLNKIEPYRLAVATYLHDSEVEVSVRIDCRCPDSIGGISVQSDLMRRLSILSSRVDISFIGEPAEPEPSETDAPA